MKNKIKATILFFGMIFLAAPLTAQVLAPGDPGSEPQPGDQPLGGGAPVGGGTFILLALGAAYGGKKIMNVKQKKKNL